eukprot:372045-Amorphochlora_amoeboformis.AAC.1
MLQIDGKTTPPTHRVPLLKLIRESPGTSENLRESQRISRISETCRNLFNTSLGETQGISRNLEMMSENLRESFMLFEAI